MLDVIDVSQDVLPVATLVDALSAEAAPSRRELLLVRLHAQQEEARVALKEQADTLEKLYVEGRRDAVDPTRLVENVLEGERADAEKIRPAIWMLRHKLATRRAILAPEIQRSIQESLDILEAWLQLYRDIHGRLLKLAAEPRDNPSSVMHARPVEGEIDYAELSREHIARYPKIRAALAK
jgi:hypothetical protein